MGDEPSLLPPILLGVADRALKRGPATDLLGITTMPLLPLYPCSIRDWVAILAFPLDQRLRGTKSRIRFTDLRKPDSSGWIDFDLREMGAIAEGAAEPVERLMREQPIPIRSGPEASSPQLWRFIGAPNSPYALVPVSCPSLTLMEPGKVQVTWEFESDQTPLGELSFGFYQAPPLSPGEIQALLARPEQYRVLRFDFSCSQCADVLQVFETIDESAIEDSPELQSMTRLCSAPEHWRCGCGASEIDTRWAAAAIPHFFRQSHAHQSTSEISLVGAYRSTRIASIIDGYRSLIRSSPAEEDAQRYLQDNPLFWGFLAPKHIRHKPPILNKYVADFGIVSANKTLYLVELEKPQTKLLTRAGGKSSQVQRAFDQVRDWKNVVRAHRHAVLEMLDLSDRTVRDIRYLIVAGIDSEEAATLRTDLPADTGFLTYEELAAQLAILQAQMAGL